MGLFASLGASLRRSLRPLRSNPSLVVVATISIGLGVGLNTAFFSVFRAVFLAPPSVAVPETLVRIEPGNGNQISYPNLADLSAGGTIRGFAGYAVSSVALGVHEAPQKVLAFVVTPTFFEVAGIRPALGRTFANEADVAVVTDAFCRRHFARGTNPVGAPITVNGQVLTVVGVLPAGHRALTGAVGPEVYLPLTDRFASGFKQRDRPFLTLLARLAGRPSNASVRQEIQVQAAALERAYPLENAGLAKAAFVFPTSGLAGWQRRDVSAAALAGMAAGPFILFGLVLLIACANVAGLLLASGMARRREIAVMFALGASRSRILAGLLGESLVLSLAGGAVGVTVAYWISAVASTIVLPNMTEAVPISCDWPVLAYGLLLALSVTTTCGVVPALVATKQDVMKDVIASSRASTTGNRSRGVLVVGQVTVAAFLIFASLLCVRSLAAMRNTDPGFAIDAVAVASVEMDHQRYPDEAGARLAQDAIARVRTLPGVRAASVTSLIPLGGDVASTSFEVAGVSAPRTETFLMNVGAEYFRTMDIPLERGRAFNASDVKGGPERAIVNAAFARMYALDQPIGTRVRQSDHDPWLEIVGVVRDSKYGFFAENVKPTLYRPYQQAGGRLFLVARGDGAPSTLLPSIRGALSAIDPTLLVTTRTLRDATSLEGSLRGAFSWILGVVGGLGLALALVGLYGLLSYMVSRRFREMGIRMALGASTANVRSLVLANAARLVGLGTALGMLGATLAARPLASALSGIGATDPVTSLVTAALLLGSGMLAAYRPALLATRANPADALRAE